MSEIPPPEVRFTTTSDGITLAYWVIGSGPVLIHTPGVPFSHVQLEWDADPIREGYEALARECTLVRFDARGTGLSQRDGVTFDSLGWMLKDLEAVIKAIGRPVTILGMTFWGQAAIAYAIQHPEQVEGIITWCTWPTGQPYGESRTVRSFLRLAAEDWNLFCKMAAHVLPNVGDDPTPPWTKYVQAWVRQEEFLACAKVLYSVDVADLLGKVGCPTLVLYRSGVGMPDMDDTRRLAAGIPGARLRVLEGTSGVPYLGDSEASLGAIIDFMAERQPAREGLRIVPVAEPVATSESAVEDPLSDRERDVLRLIMRGRTNQEIAGELSISMSTVATHVRHILEKTNTANRTEAARYGTERGIG